MCAREEALKGKLNNWKSSLNLGHKFQALHEFSVLAKVKANALECELFKVSVDLNEMFFCLVNSIYGKEQE